MHFTADLHLHSKYSSAVSKNMTVEVIAGQARRKGINLIATGDCLQPQWLWELEQKLVLAEPGWFQLVPEVEAEVLQQLPPLLREAPLRWVLNTEVCCAPVGTPRLGGIHHLIYFPSFSSVKGFQKKVEGLGDLWEGRPELRLTSKQLLILVAEHGADCHMAPAHVMNPYFSCLGSNMGHSTLEELLGETSSRFFAVETGLTSIPAMCRRIPSLNPFTLFSNSDAHSPDNIGRECTLLDIAPGYDHLFAALKTGLKEEVLGTLKYPLYHTRYYLNRCAPCAESFEGKICPKCGGGLVLGSRDYLEKIAACADLAGHRQDPPHRQLLPLKELLAPLFGVKSESENKKFLGLFETMLAQVGHERFILTEADYETLARKSTRQIAEAILSQREADTEYFKPAGRMKEPLADPQLSLL